MFRALSIRSFLPLPPIRGYGSTVAVACMIAQSKSSNITAAGWRWSPPRSRYRTPQPWARRSPPSRRGSCASSASAATKCNGSTKCICRGAISRCASLSRACATSTVVAARPRPSCSLAPRLPPTARCAGSCFETADRTTLIAGSLAAVPRPEAAYAVPGRRCAGERPKERGGEIWPSTKLLPMASFVACLQPAR